MEETVSVEYRLSITFAEIDLDLDLPDRLLAVLLEEMPEAGPVIDQNPKAGLLTVVVAFETARPTDEVARMKSALDSALARAGVQDDPTVLDVHVEAVDDAEDPPAAAREALHQPA
jgi:hypothetical protein